MNEREEKLFVFFRYMFNERYLEAYKLLGENPEIVRYVHASILANLNNKIHKKNKLEVCVV